VSVVLALLAGYGAFLCYTGLALGWQGLGPGPQGSRRRRPASRTRQLLLEAGFEEVRPVEFAAVVALLAVVGLALGLAVFGGPVPGLACALLAAAGPVTASRARRQRRREEARADWPRLIEQMRVATGALGRSVPQALFEAGRNAPPDLRSAFSAAEREWLVSTDFARTMAVLKARLADPAADAIAETLLVAHEVGGRDLDRRLAALAEDRVQELEGRKDALAKQAGARFARRFVLAVPLGMALAGASIGAGRSAYATPFGQAAVVVGVAATAACWLWAGHLLRLPDFERVFADRETPDATRGFGEAEGWRA
jgi:tight adherence protein B